MHEDVVLLTKKMDIQQEDGVYQRQQKLSMLSNYQHGKKIPVLFGNVPNTGTSTTNYWSANGRVAVTYDTNGNGTVNTYTTANNNNEYYVRCVYDTWYWTDKCNPITNFTWGDKQDF